MSYNSNLLDPVI